MGESSFVETPEYENKEKQMGEIVVSVGGLEQSVSFGRFEEDESLCWERWSSFPSNKYMEEVEKCSTPGSVAKKAAYFEAHYKKIAARKTELMYQENKTETGLLNSEDQTEGLMDSDCNKPNSSEEERDGEQSDTQPCVCAAQLEVNNVQICESFDFINEENNGELNSSDFADIMNEEKQVADEHVDDANRVNDIVKESTESEDAHHNSRKQEPDEESSELGKPEEPVPEKEEDVVVLQNKEEVPRDEVEENKMTKKAAENVKLKTSQKTQKVKSMKKTNTTNMTRKAELTIPKRSAPAVQRSPVLSTPKPLKPALSTSAMSITRPLVKKEKTPSALSARKDCRPEIKRVLPTSLHMSLSLGKPHSDPSAFTTTRKSLIMERMGDKDIVKRAFKTFQNSSQRSPSNILKTPPSSAQSTARKNDRKSSATAAFQKKNEGVPRAAKPSSPLTSQQATRKTSASPELPKTAGADRRNIGSVKPSLSSLSSKSQDLGSNQKEGSKDLGQKGKTKHGGKTQLQSNIKLEKAASIRKPCQSKLS